MDAVSRVGPRGEGGSVTFIAGNVINTVQRSRYGKRAAQNTTREVRPARNLVSSTGGLLRSFLPCNMTSQVCS